MDVMWWHMPEEKHSAMNMMRQVAISCWAVGSFGWSFHQFLPL